MTADPMLDPRFIAGVQMLERTGARDFRVGYTDPDEGEPVVWYATCRWQIGTDGRPIAKGGRARHEAAGAMNGLDAVMRLCERVIDGGTCAHCGQHTIFDDNPTDSPFDALLEALGCVYAWDPELATFRRGCEGDT
jgi:hypothetical protein